MSPLGGQHVPPGRGDTGLFWTVSRGVLGNFYGKPYGKTAAICGKLRQSKTNLARNHGPERPGSVPVEVPSSRFAVNRTEPSS